jgi:multisubunit Na+/H+ antiporter MnhB subunit
MSALPPPPPPYGAPDHPRATTILVLGIVGLVLCQVLGPVAWSMGARTLREIDESPGRYGGREIVNVGRILGIIGTVFLVIGILGFAAIVLLGIGMATTSTSP